MAKQDDRVKIRELSPEDGDKDISSADWLAIGKKNVETTVKASVGQVIKSAILPGKNIQIKQLTDGVEVINTYESSEVDLSDIKKEQKTKLISLT